MNCKGHIAYMALENNECRQKTGREGDVAGGSGVGTVTVTGSTDCPRTIFLDIEISWGYPALVCFSGFGMMDNNRTITKGVESEKRIEFLRVYFNR